MADIFCLPSYREGMGLSLLEASSSSLPNICSKIYGTKSSIVDNQTGLYFELNKPNHLYKKIMTLINNKKLRKKLGFNGRKFVEENFEQSNVVKEFSNFINLKLK